MPGTLIGSRDIIVNKKSVKMSRDFRFIISRIEHLLCARHDNKHYDYSGEENT